MAKNKDKRQGYEKLLDFWIAPEGAGDPIGCIATSFTFSPVFFEEECLGRFLSLETDPTEDGPVYLVEREEKLSQVVCATALVDQHHCRGSRSLRWDMLPIRIKGGLQHAKISLLCWKECVRLIVASANLTGDGYRRNQEIFGVLDYKPTGEAPRPCLEEIVSFLRHITSQSESGSEMRSPAIDRVNRFLDRVLGIPADWGSENEKTGQKGIRIWPIVSGKGYPQVLDKLADVWPASSPPMYASVVSPFFDPPATENRPAEELWSILRKRGQAGVEFYITADEVPGETELFLHAPESLLSSEPPNRPDVSTRFYQLELDEGRPLHAKAIWLEDDRWAFYMVGSSNFTSAGLGLSNNPNLEANLAYAVDSTPNPKAHRLMGKSFLKGDAIDIEAGVKWKPRLDDEDESPADTVLLPEAFGSAIYDHDKLKHPVVTLTFTTDPPVGWKLSLDDATEPFFSESGWKERGSPERISLPWTPTLPPSGFIVRWSNSTGQAWWPVNVATAATLPPPEELKDLPLDVLIHILTSARPLHRAIEGYLKRKKRKGADKGTTLIDPHAKVDTSKFLLQRTRRVSGALNALRARIERPVVTEDCLHWRLRGPVGVVALKDALVKEGSTDEERAFLLSELALELGRVKLKREPGCLTPQKIRAELAGIISEIRAEIPKEALGKLTNLKTYVDDVFRAISQ